MRKYLILFICIFALVGLSSAETVNVGVGQPYPTDGIDDHIQIQQALDYIDTQGGGTVYLNGPNTFWISDTLEMGENTILTGDSTAEVKLLANQIWTPFDDVLQIISQ